jgi:hypothetical protein
VILVDTSVWVDHLRRGNTRLGTLLHRGEVICHPFVIGELACGTLKQRGEILRLLEELPAARVATHREVMAMLQSQRLMGCGLGYVDLHLVAAARLDHVPLWTLDKRLAGTAARVGVGA